MSTQATSQPFVTSTAQANPVPHAGSERRRRPLVWIATAVIAAVAIGAALWLARPDSPTTDGSSGSTVVGRVQDTSVYGPGSSIYNQQVPLEARQQAAQGDFQRSVYDQQVPLEARQPAAEGDYQGSVYDQQVPSAAR
jgi:hypothetical protein